MNARKTASLRAQFFDVKKVMYNDDMSDKAEQGLEKNKEFEKAAEKQRLSTVGRAFLIYLCMAGVIFVLCLIGGLLSGGKSFWTSDPFSFAVFYWIFIMIGGSAAMAPIAVLVAWIKSARNIQTIRENYNLDGKTEIRNYDPKAEKEKENAIKAATKTAVNKSGLICGVVVFVADFVSVPLLFLMEGYDLFYEVAGMYLVAICAVIAGYNRGCVCYAKVTQTTSTVVPKGTRDRITIRAILIAMAHCLFIFIMLLVAKNTNTAYIW